MCGMPHFAKCANIIYAVGEMNDRNEVGDSRYLQW